VDQLSNWPRFSCRLNPNDTRCARAPSDRPVRP